MKRNSHVLPFEVELSESIEKPELALSAANLLAKDVGDYLSTAEWGFGRARIESVRPAWSLQVEVNPDLAVPRFLVAWNIDNDNPNPHPWESDGGEFLSASQAEQYALERSADIEDELYMKPWVVIAP